MKRIIPLLVLTLLLVISIASQAQTITTVTVDYSTRPVGTFCRDAFSDPLIAGASNWSFYSARITASNLAGGSGPECSHTIWAELVVYLAAPADAITIQMKREPGSVIRFYLYGAEVYADQIWYGVQTTYYRELVYDQVVFEATSYVQSITFQWGLPAVPSSPTDDAEFELLPTFYDGRINDFDTGNPVALFGHNYGEDGWGLDIYHADDTGLALSVTPEEIAAVEECPTVNTLIAQNEESGVALYRLPARPRNGGLTTVCPFQLNAPTQDAGKIYIIIFDGLQPHSYYESWEEYIGG